MLDGRSEEAEFFQKAVKLAPFRITQNLHGLFQHGRVMSENGLNRRSSLSRELYELCSPVVERRRSAYKAFLFQPIHCGGHRPAGQLEFVLDFSDRQRAFVQ